MIRKGGKKGGGWKEKESKVDGIENFSPNAALGEKMPRSWSTVLVVHN